MTLFDGVADPDPYLESGSGSRRAKMTHKNRKKFTAEKKLKNFYIKKYKLPIPRPP
jgi:hypothetical protein